jgi:hypothetical protein
MIERARRATSASNVDYVEAYAADTGLAPEVKHWISWTTRSLSSGPRTLRGRRRLSGVANHAGGRVV